MKTIDGFLKEISTSKELQEELKAIKDIDGLTAFLKNHDVNATAEEFGKAVKSLKSGTEGEISDDDAEAVAGGAWYDFAFRWIPGYHGF